MKFAPFGPKSDAQASNMLIFNQKALDRRRKRWLFHENMSFSWLKSARQASQTATCSWKRVISDQNPMHRRRKRWFWTKIRSTGVANGDFFMKTCHFRDLNPLDRRRKRRLVHESGSFPTKIRCTGVANADFGPNSAPQASQTVIF